MSVLRALLGAGAGLAAGAVVGVVGVLWHHAQVVLLDRTWPLGVVLVVLIAALTALVLGSATSGPGPLVLFVLVLAATNVLASRGGPGGDVLVVDDLLGQVYLLGTGLAAVVGLVLVRRVRRAAPRPRLAPAAGRQVAP